MLILCPECNNEFSSRAQFCPKCGLPMAQVKNVREEKKEIELKYIEEHSFYSKDLQVISKNNSEIVFSLMKNHPLGFKTNDVLTFRLLGFMDHLLKIKHGIYLLEGNATYKSTGFFSSERIVSYAIARLDYWDNAGIDPKVWYTGVDENLTDFRPWLKPPSAGTWTYIGILDKISTPRHGVRCIDGVLKLE